MKAQVALAHGSSRYDNISQVLALVADQIDLRSCQNVLIKPNLVSTTRQLPSTHVAAIQAVLDFVRARYTGPLTLAEGSALSHTLTGFESFGYRQVANRYGARLIDLNADQTIPVQVYDRRLRPRTLRLARTVVDSDFRISVSPPKTHDTVIVTLSLKNMIMGTLVNPTVATADADQRAPVSSPLTRMLRRAAQELCIPTWAMAHLRLGQQSDKLAMHQGFPIINLNLALLAPWVKPHLAVIDGFEAMEGAGPVDGDPVDWQLALAGTDALAVDSLTAHLMGFDPVRVGYLNYCRHLELGVGELERIEVLGEVAPDAVRREFRRHPTYSQQCGWHLPNVERWLRPAAEVRLAPAEN